MKNVYKLTQKKEAYNPFESKNKVGVKFWIFIKD